MDGGVEEEKAKEDEDEEDEDEDQDGEGWDDMMARGEIFFRRHRVC